MMLTLTTRRGRAALLAVTALVVTMVACDTSAPSAPEVEVDPGVEEDEAADDDAPVEADEASDEEVDDAEMQASLAALDYNSCHDHQRAGGASDGVFAFSVPGAPDGAQVEVDVTLQDGERTETLQGTVEGGRVVVLAPLSSFGEVVEVTAIRVDGVELDLSGLGSTSFTVDSASDCTNHPDA